MITYLIKKFVAPALPTYPIEYDQRQLDQLNYALRIYFNNLDRYLSTLSGPTGGGNLGLPHISASSSSDLYASGDDTATLIVFDTPGSVNGFTLNLDGSATCNVSGVYKITYSLQLTNNNTASEHNAYVWLKTDGTLVSNSTTAFTLPKAAAVDTYVGAYSEVVFEIAAGEEIRLYWATDKAATSGGTKGVYIYAEPAQVSPYARPAIPSAIGSITFVSALTT